MSQADISVLAELQLSRDSWRTELAGAKSDLEKFASDAKDLSLKLPVVFDYAQVRTALDKLQADVATMGGIKVPVTLVPTGGPGGDWRSAMAEVSAGYGGGGNAAAAAVRDQYRDFLAARIAKRPGGMGGGIEPYGVAGDTYDVAPMDGPWGSGPLAEVGGAELAAEEFGDPWNSYGSGMRGSAARRATTERSGGMRGLRLFLAAHIASRGVEAAYGSYEFDNRNLSLENGLGGLAGFKAETEARNKMREGFFGLTGAGRDLAHFALSNTPSLSGLASRFDDSEDANELRRLTRMETRAQKAHRLTQFELTEGIGRSRGSYLGEQERAEASTLHSRIFGGKFEGSNAEIDQELNKQKDAAQKRAESMRELGASEKAITAEYNDLLQSAESQASSRRQMVLRQQASFMNQTAIMAAKASGDVEGARRLSRGTRDLELQEQYGYNEYTTGRLAALHAGDVREDQLRNLAVGTEASISLSRVQGLRAALSGDSLSAAQYRIGASKAEQLNAIQQRKDLTEDQKNTLARQTNDLASLQDQEAQKADTLKWARLTDEVHELGLVSPYARRIDALQHERRRQMENDPAHASDWARYYDAEIGATNRMHNVAIGAIQNQRSVFAAATGGRFSFRFQAGHRPEKMFEGPNPSLAAALQEGYGMEQEIASHQDDPVMQRELIARDRERLQEELKHATDSPTRNAISSFLQHMSVADQKAAADANKKPVSGGGSASTTDLGKAAAALEAAAAVIKGAQALYIVK